MDERSLTILSLKKLRKAEGRLEDGMEKGSLGADFRLSSLSSEVQSFLGSLVLLAIRLR